VLGIRLDELGGRSGTLGQGLGPGDGHGKKSTPVTRAPRRTQLRVSMPKWQCR
jgi:hypothetical protein